jgi:predicted dinucleotide-binding enzyme
VLPEGQSSGSVIAGLLREGARFVKALGTLSAESLAAETRRTPDPAVLFYATDDAGAGEAIERLIQTAGFDPVSAGGLKDCLRIEVGGTCTNSAVSTGTCSASSRPAPPSSNHREGMTFQPTRQ